jgi:hypothetical protein
VNSSEEDVVAVNVHTWRMWANVDHHHPEMFSDPGHRRYALAHAYADELPQQVEVSIDEG